LPDSTLADTFNVERTISPAGVYVPENVVAWPASPPVSTVIVPDEIDVTALND